MNKELAFKWVSALRSGNYKQGKNFLIFEKGGEREHCCLGVLCEIAGVEMEEVDEHHPLFSESLPPGDKTFIVSGDESASGLIPSDIWDGFGFPVDQEYLAELNDLGETFEYIAREIEERVIDVHSGQE